MKVIACLLLVAFIYCVGHVASLQCYVCTGMGTGTDYDNCLNKKDTWNLTTCPANTTNCFSVKLMLNSTYQLYGRGCARQSQCSTSKLTNATAACLAVGASDTSSCTISSSRCCTSDKCNGGTAVLPQVTVMSALIAVSLAAVLQ
ncbi:uncharacterized protein LOC144928049 [Branchiostoma floridae x Branchiostoma belcheri]